MRKSNIVKVFSVVLAFAMLFSTAPLSVTAENTAPQKAIVVEQGLLDEMQAHGQASYIVKFENEVDLSPAYQMNWEDRGQFVYEMLKKQAELSQAQVQQYLQINGVAFDSFWIDNSLFVRQSEMSVLTGIQSFEGVESIRRPKMLHNYEPEPAGDAQPMGVEANISHVQAPEVWANGFRGEGLTVANIDSGVRYTHAALKNAYRGKVDGGYNHNYNWLDPYASAYQAPQDDNGHGTHTMGTMVGKDEDGTNQIGMAPGAQWMACRGCNDQGCSEASLLACAQFVTAPTKLDGSNADPTKRPVVVNNSWGDCGQSYDGWYQQVVNTWLASGIYPVFSNGNASNCEYPSNPPLGTVGNPARYGNVSGVGSTGRNNGLYASHSNKGPTDNLDAVNPTDGLEDLKPQFAAPGVSIRSALNGHDNAYASYNGTSMSAPHVSGLIALMVQAGPCLQGNYAALETIIENTATTIPYAYPPGSDPMDVNMATGWGEINALAAVTAAAGSCGSASIKGTVRSSVSGNPPVAGASVVATAEEEQPRTAKTDADGAYAFSLNPGNWTITASKFGYDDAVGQGVVAENETITIDLEMVAHPSVKLSGTVRDAGLSADNQHGYPLYAKITLSTEGFSESFYTDPFTGQYETDVYVNKNYTITVDAQLNGYQLASETFTPTADLVKDFDLGIITACVAPGYAMDYLHFYDFEGSDHGFVAGGTNASWAWGDFSSGPGQAISGIKGIATNPSGAYNANENSWIESPVIDLSAYSDRIPVIQFWNWLYTESLTSNWDAASVQVSKDGGENWETVWGPNMRQDTVYQKQDIVLDSSYAVENFKFRFAFRSDESEHEPGWYIDDIGVAAVSLGEPEPEHIVSYHFDDESEPEWETGFSNGANEWEKGIPTSGPGAAHSAPNVWATNLEGEYEASRTSFITSPTIDLSAHAGKAIIVKWYDWLQVESGSYSWDYGSVWASNDGGSTFTQIGSNIKRVDEGTDYTASEIEIPSIYATADFKVRFRYRADSLNNALGWYIDDVGVYVQDSALDVAIPCLAQPGGIVAGYVHDKNHPGENIRIMGAKVETGQTAMITAPRAKDPARDGLYYFYHPTEGTEELISFTVSKENFGTKVYDRTIQADVVNHEDFEIGTGRLVVEPGTLEHTLYLNAEDESTTLTITNTGAGDGSFSIAEFNKGFEPLGQALEPRKLNIPRFTGTKEPNLNPSSIFRDPNAMTQNGPSEPKLNASAAQYGITMAPGAVGVDAMTDKLYRWDNLTETNNYVVKGSVSPAGDLYAGDFLGGDYQNLYAYSHTSGNFYSIDVETAQPTLIKNFPVPEGKAMTGLSGAEDFFYAVSTDCSSASSLHRLDPDGTLTKIGDMTDASCLIDIAYVPSENLLYGIDLETDSLYSIDPETAHTTYIGELGYNMNYAQGIDYDEANGIMYWAAYSNNASLRVIDLESGASTEVASFPASTEFDSYAIESSTGGGGAVPWLEENPTEGLLHEGETMTVAVTYSVADLEQPGDYFADLRFRTNTPYNIDPVAVTLHVLRPENWGTLKGTVTATEKCDLDPAPKAKATVKIYKDGELFKTTLTDENGFYSYALESGRYDIEFSGRNYVTQRIEAVEIASGEDFVLDHNLRLDSPCLTVSVESLFAEIYPNQRKSQTFKFLNTGAKEAVIETYEIPGEGPVPYGKAAVELALDDGTYDDSIGIGGTRQFMVLNRYTPDEELFPFTLNAVKVYFAVTNGGAQVGDEIEIYVYQNTTSAQDPATGSEFRLKQSATVSVLDDWNEITLEEPVTFEGPGDVLIGVGFKKVPGEDYFPAASDATNSQRRSWAGWWTGEIPEVPTLPPNAVWTLIDDASADLAGNWMIRGIGETDGDEPGDILWFELDPTAGVVAKDGGELEVTAHFDSNDLVWGDYFGQIMVENKPDPKVYIPVNLRVLPLNLLHLPIIQTFSPQN